MFRYPKFNREGEKVLCKMDGIGKEMLMDASVFKLKKGTSRTFTDSEKEIVILLIDGKVRFISDGIDEVADRKSLFDDMPTTVHIAKGKSVVVEALKSSRIMYLATTNERDFATKIYRKKDVIRTVSCENMWENTAVRDVNTIFDYENAPYSNLVIGEVLARQGRWWSYVPHSHPQPEVYYYEFERKEGFGACFIGEKAYTVKNGSVGGFVGGKTHVQVTAPGFPMYNIWMIRHLDGDPWKKTRVVDPRYTWLEPEVKFIPKNEEK